jgi:hypothetical protein
MSLGVMTGELSAFPRTTVAPALLALALGVAGQAFGGAAQAAPLGALQRAFQGRPAAQDRGSAERPGALRDSLLGGQQTEGRAGYSLPVARYVSEDGDVFTLDRTQSRPLLKFENNGEVWVLQPQPAPRGDVIYKNELGEPVLRATRLGGVTLFTEDRPAGQAAALQGSGSPIRLTVLGPQALFERLAQASFRASRATRHGVIFDAEATPGSSALIADAAMVASLAVVRAAERPEAQGFLARLKRVFLTEGRKASAQFDQGTLTITVVPVQGLAGRPSSDRIMQIAVKR